MDWSALSLQQRIPQVVFEDSVYFHAFVFRALESETEPLQKADRGRIVRCHPRFHAVDLIFGEHRSYGGIYAFCGIAAVPVFMVEPVGKDSTVERVWAYPVKFNISYECFRMLF